jgi:hypothetical protein
MAKTTKAGFIIALVFILILIVWIANYSYQQGYLEGFNIATMNKGVK